MVTKGLNRYSDKLGMIKTDISNSIDLIVSFCSKEQRVFGVITNEEQKEREIKRRRIFGIYARMVLNQELCHARGQRLAEWRDCSDKEKEGLNSIESHFLDSHKTREI